jgi:hypothetical protein
MDRSSPSKLFSLVYPSIVLFVVLAGPVAGWTLYPSPAMPFFAGDVSGVSAAIQPQAIPCAL